jgi:hypothetical protein
VIEVIEKRITLKEDIYLHLSSLFTKNGHCSQACSLMSTVLKQLFRNSEK